MQHTKIPFKNTKIFSPFFLDYIERKETLKKFYHRAPSIQSFEAQIQEKQKSFSIDSRTILSETLREQYKELKISNLVDNNIKSLKDATTFTITTGHQLNIFTGPLYFIYKIVSVINACKQLKRTYPKYNFVPVYWMASEDHDFEEISYFKLYGKKYKWDTDQKGGVGRFSPKSLQSILKELPGDVSIFEKAYLKHEKLSDAVRYYVNELFGNEGLVVVDADNRKQKSLFAEVITDDLFKHTAKSKVETTNALLNAEGYSTQVYARDINFFYLENNLRSRIERTTDGFTVVDSDISFTDEEAQSLIKNEPEKFSPNVILRPLYQEIILPNLAYFGGPAEVIYWLQLKGVFDHFSVPFPVLMPRNFALVLDGPIARKFEKTGLSAAELFDEKTHLFNDWVSKNSHHNLLLTDELKTVNSLFEKVKKQALEIDSTLGPLVEAESKRAIRSFEKIEQKLLRAEKRHHSDKLRQIEEVKEALFPNGGLQERSDNFLNFYQQDPQFINKALAVFDPFDFEFNLLSYPYSK
ncbi:MAG TPA: bacillithiol biosynthesis cysteine-adding enzyme BshC [Cytophagales bacterium]|mgnify:CR=1 FL=1|nr:bacillithiol biosynthesis cysteine-adding enzyme BshC [Cytophagales bacterium]